MLKNIFSNSNIESSALFLGLLTMYNVYFDIPINIPTILFFSVLFMIFNIFSLKKNDNTKE